MYPRWPHIRSILRWVVGRQGAETSLSSRTSAPQVPLGSVTPLALVQESASKVVLLVDQKVKSATTLGLHPLINTKTLALTPADLETFLRFQPLHMQPTCTPSSVRASCIAMTPSLVPVQLDWQVGAIC